MTDAIEKHREMLETVAERDDLRISKYAQAILEEVAD